MASGFGPRGPQARQTHVIPFHDHAGQAALTVFESSSPLPFLYSFPVYFTHPDVSPATSHAAELYQTVTQGPLYDSNAVEYRLDLYFLPNATQDDCIAHYRAEKDARGTFQAQIDTVATGGGGGGGEGQGEGEGQGQGVTVPGLVPSYAAHDRARFRYHGLLLACAAADWRAGDQLLSLVEFDPLSRGDYERYSKDPEDPREPEELPPARARPVAAGEASPGFGRELPRPDFSVRALGASLWERVPKQRFGQEAWQEARNRGWTTW